MEVGDKVKAKINLDEYNDCHGHSRCAAKGDVLIIRSLTSLGEFLVSHEDRTDGMTFYATKDELELLK